MIAWYPSPDATNSNRWDETSAVVSSDVWCSLRPLVGERRKTSKWENQFEHQEWLASWIPRHRQFIERPACPQTAVKISGWPHRRGPSRRAAQRKPWW